MKATCYNEHDTFAAAWLRELIKDGLISPHGLQLHARLGGRVRDTMISWERDHAKRRLLGRKRGLVFYDIQGRWYPVGGHGRQEFRYRLRKRFGRRWVEMGTYERRYEAQQEAAVDAVIGVQETR